MFDPLATPEAKMALVNRLHNEILTVRFTKADGTVREMKCTLRDDYLPTPNGPQLLTEENQPSLNNVAVWDVDLSAWRSFRYDSVLEIKE